jgi:hypothetical protein
VARSVFGMFFTSVKYTKSRPFSFAPEILINASRVNCVDNNGGIWNGYG